MSAQSALDSLQGLPRPLGHQTKSEVRLGFYRMQRRGESLWGKSGSGLKLKLTSISCLRQECKEIHIHERALAH